MIGGQLTKGELQKISDRITQIEQLYEDHPPETLADDILDSLERELQGYIYIIEESIRLGRLAKFKVVR